MLKLHKTICSVTLFFIVNLFFTSIIFACAISAKANDWFMTPYHFQKNEMTIFKNYQFVKGKLISDSKVNELNDVTLNGKLNKQQFIFYVRKNDELIGELFLPIPKNATYFGSDFMPATRADHVILYKELRFKMKAEVKDKLETLLKTNTVDAQLIFRGRGNQCLEQTDFNSWVLLLNTPHQTLKFAGSIHIELETNFIG